MTAPRRGFVYWAGVPDDKRRPVVVVSPDARNAMAGDVLVVPISSVLRDGPWHVRMRRGEAGIATASVAKCEQITTLRRDRLDPRPLGAALSAARMGEIEIAVMRAIGIPID